MNAKELAEAVSSGIASGNSEEARSVIASLETPDLIDALPFLSLEEVSAIIELSTPETASSILLALEPAERERLLDRITPERIAEIAGTMDSDDAADIISELPQDAARAVLTSLTPQEVSDVESLMRYPDDSAGGIMQTELVKVQYDATAKETIEWIRLIADEVEDIYQIFVTDHEDRLLGIVPLKKIILANPSTRVSTLMEPPEITVTPLVDQERVAELAKKHDLVIIPVVDEGGVLLGCITADDVIDVVAEEASQDILQLAGAGDFTHPLYTPTRERLRMRIPWILMTLLGELVIAFIIVHFFKETIEKVAILAAFMPAIMATGGNVGIQSTAIMVRGIGMGTISVRQTMKVMASEIRLALLLGALSAVIAASIGALISFREPEVVKVSLAVFLAMTSATLATTFMGVAMPVVLYKFGLDPAVSSSPFVTMANDLFGSVFYLLIALMLF